MTMLLRASAATAILLATLAAGCQFDRPEDVGDAGADATDAPVVAIDAPVDAPGLAAYDIAYPAEWRMSVQGPATSFIVIVNTGPSPLSLSTFQVTGLSDDHPTAVVRVTSPGSFGDTLQPDTAAGALSGLAETLLIGSGLVPEAWSVRTTDFLSLELLNAPAGTYDIAVNLTVELDGRPASLPMTIHVVPGPTIYLDPLVGRRLTVYR
ncbi:MAG: hypothetical protein IPH44_38520 [Myxococcales bacterium]|nr:hypothetical protein [Myxococcales bacterium]MBK7197621.1 hypothetical protein [Myxococcales bacterium]